MKLVRCLAALLVAGAAWLRAAEESVVALPPFLVEEAHKGPPWRYATKPGYEILSRCADPVTRRVVGTHERLHQLLGEILPPSLQLRCDVPRTFILYDDELQPAASREVIARMLQQDAATLPDDFSPSPGFRLPRNGPSARRMSFLPNLRLWDRDAVAIFMIVRRDDFNADTLSLTHDYISFLVKSRMPSLPPWFVSGFLTLYAQIHFEVDRLTLEPLEWISPFHTQAVKKDPKTVPPLLPLENFLTMRFAAPDPTPAYDPIKMWQAQAALFVRWGLEADGGAHRAALWKFAERTALHPVTEEIFAECFGLDFAAAQAQLAAYLPVAVKKSATFRLRRDPPKSAPLALRNATDGEIARLKGDWERLEVPYVKKISPELAPKYLEQARRTFRRAYDRNERDPRLLAAMGLCEVDAGDDAAAREYLEAAVDLGPIRPRANYELARLRFAAARAQPAGASGQIDAAQVAEVFKPLFAARAGEPPLPEVYDLVAEVWAIAANKASRGHLAVLDEGIRLFPRRIPLLLRTAELNLRHGYKAEAAGLASLLEKVTLNDDERARLASLRLAVTDFSPPEVRE